MLLSSLRPFFEPAVPVGSVVPEEPSILIVVATGLTLVFSILVILTIVLVLEGKIFSSIDKRKKDKTAEQEAPKTNISSISSVPPAAAAPAVNAGIPPEVVAAIAAAVASIEDGRYTLRSVTASQKGRGQWGLAGVISYTEPF